MKKSIKQIIGIVLTMNIMCASLLVGVVHAEKNTAAETVAEAVSEASDETVAFNVNSSGGGGSSNVASLYPKDTLVIQPVVRNISAVAGTQKFSFDSKVSGQKIIVDYEILQNAPVGFNNYSLYLTYNPKVVKAVRADNTASNYITYTNNFKDSAATATARLYDVQELNKQMSIKPSADDADYKDVAANGVKTAAELGKIKYASVSLQKEQDKLVNITGVGTLLSVEFEVLAVGDAKLGVKFVKNGFNAVSASTAAINTSASDGKLIVESKGSENTSESTTESTTSEPPAHSAIKAKIKTEESDYIKNSPSYTPASKQAAEAALNAMTQGLNNPNLTLAEAQNLIAAFDTAKASSTFAPIEATELADIDGIPGVSANDVVMIMSKVILGDSYYLNPSQVTYAKVCPEDGKDTITINDIIKALMMVLNP